MKDANKKPFTGWLVLLMVLLVLGCTKVQNEIRDVGKVYEPDFPHNSPLWNAFFIYQLVLYASVATALYTVWVLYKRVPGTLSIVKLSFLFTVVLRIAAPWIFDLLSGLPSESKDEMLFRLECVVAAVGVSAAWYVYLARSKRVHDIYGAQELAPHEPPPLAPVRTSPERHAP